jgi:hypothetical protein
LESSDVAVDDAMDLGPARNTFTRLITFSKAEVKLSGDLPAAI